MKVRLIIYHVVGAGEKLVGNFKVERLICFAFLFESVRILISSSRSRLSAKIAAVTSTHPA